VLARVLEGQLELVADLFVNAAGKIEVARFGHRFDAGGQVDAFALNIFAFVDNLAKVDADAKMETPAGVRARPGSAVAASLLRWSF
jgi:hypothetical protein